MAMGWQWGDNASEKLSIPCPRKEEERDGVLLNLTNRTILLHQTA